MITQDKLHTLFSYIDGVLIRKVCRSDHKKIGNFVGSLDKHGYLQVTIDKKSYRVHRLIYLMHFGQLPEFLDHIDNNKLNNKIDNLRPATKIQNAHNQTLSKNNTSGIKGVYWEKERNKWRAQIRIKDSKVKFFGRFEDIELAKIAVMNARKEHHGEFANHGGA